MNAVLHNRTINQLDHSGKIKAQHLNRKAIIYPLAQASPKPLARRLMQQLCGSGMHWKNQGAIVILSLCAWVQSKGRWQQCWDKID